MHSSEESVAAFWINFPDPWPKKRHHKRRIVQPPFVELVASRLAPGGEFLLAERKSSGIPEFSWDGHQISAGLVWRDQSGRLSAYAGPVLYALSNSRRSSTIGARAGFSVRF